MPNIPDEQLVVECLKGNEKSLENLVQRYFKAIYNFVYRFVNDQQVAEDITQEVFVKVWKNLRKFKKDKSFKTWIFFIAKNTALDWLKKKKAILFSELETNEGENKFIETLADPAPLPDEIFERKDLKQTLDAAINQLALKQRIVLFLHYNDHFTFQEIEEILSEPLNTVKSRHHRALIMLRKLLSFA